MVTVDSLFYEKELKHEQPGGSWGLLIGFTKKKTNRRELKILSVHLEA